MLVISPSNRLMRGMRELKLQAQHHTNALRDIVLLKRELAQRG